MLYKTAVTACNWKQDGNKREKVSFQASLENSKRWILSNPNLKLILLAMASFYV